MTNHHTETRPAEVHVEESETVQQLRRELEEVRRELGRARRERDAYGDMAHRWCEERDATLQRAERAEGERRRVHAHLDEISDERDELRLQARAIHSDLTDAGIDTHHGERELPLRERVALLKACSDEAERERDILEEQLSDEVQRGDRAEGWIDAMSPKLESTHRQLHELREAVRRNLPPSGTRVPNVDSVSVCMPVEALRHLQSLVANPDPHPDQDHPRWQPLGETPYSKNPIATVADQGDGEDAGDEIADRYKRIGESDWLKEKYGGKPLGVGESGEDGESLLWEAIESLSNGLHEERQRLERMEEALQRWVNDRHAWKPDILRDALGGDDGTST